MENGKEHNNQQRTKENEHRILGRLGYFLVECGSVAAIDIFILFGVFDFGLELRVLVEVKASVVGCRSSGDEAAKAGRYRH